MKFTILSFLFLVCVTFSSYAENFQIQDGLCVSTASIESSINTDSQQRTGKKTQKKTQQNSRTSDLQMLNSFYKKYILNWENTPSSWKNYLTKSALRKTYHENEYEAGEYDYYLDIFTPYDSQDCGDSVLISPLGNGWYRVKFPYAQTSDIVKIQVVNGKINDITHSLKY